MRDRSSQRRAGLGVLILLWLAGFYLRTPVLLIPPLSPNIRAEFGLAQAALGALTTVPVLMLAVGAVCGSALVGRLGARAAVVAALGLIALASAARGLAPDIVFLFAATVATGLGVAVLQPALAALANRLSPAGVALAIGVYMNGMYAGEFASAGLTRVTLLPLLSGDWRWVLIVCSIPALPILVAVARLRIADDASDASAQTQRAPLWPDWRNALMWRLGLLLSATSVLFMGTNAYMADLVNAEANPGALQTALFWFNLSQVVISLAMLAVAERLVMRRWPIVVTLTLSLAGALVFLFVGGAAGLVAAFVLGMATATQLTLVVMATPYMAPPGQTGQISAGVFTIGYGLAFVVPLIGGLFAEWMGQPWMAMLPMLAYAAATLPLAFSLRFR